MSSKCCPRPAFSTSGRRDIRRERHARDACHVLKTEAYACRCASTFHQQASSCKGLRRSRRASKRRPTALGGCSRALKARSGYAQSAHIAERHSTEVHGASLTSCSSLREGDSQRSACRRVGLNCAPGVFEKPKCLEQKAALAPDVLVQQLAQQRWLCYRCGGRALGLLRRSRVRETPMQVQDSAL